MRVKLVESDLYYLKKKKGMRKDFKELIFG